MLLLEHSDSAESGASGDGAHLLRALVEHDVADAGVIINDPRTVTALEKAGPGDRYTVTLDGKSGEIGAELLPLEVEGRV